MGEAVAGALLLGAVTSLPGIATTAIGAWQGDAQFAIANPIGGIAVQTVWLAIADLLYRRSNIEHAAASLENIMQALVLVALLCLPIVAYATPTLSVGWVHPVSLRLAALAVLVGGTGYLIGQGGLGLIAATGLPSGFVGFTITTAITSLPELVALIAAVRIGALTLGVGNILGGNAFDSLMIFLADATYRPGSIYSDAASAGMLLAGATTLLTATLAAGLILRERRGIGFEGVAIPTIYLGAVVLLLIRAA